MSSRLIIALDFAAPEQALAFVEPLQPAQCKLKVGFELFVAAGPSFVRSLVERGFDVFLDLKFHDIPNTVASAMRVLVKLGVDMTNVHAAGGVEMMQAARRGLGEDAILIAVTQLTSTSEEQMRKDQNIQTSLQDAVVHYAQKAQEAGLDGVVCSAHEVKFIKEATNPEFVCLTPGIRPSGGEIGDQKRVMTPADAARIGSDYIVVGRPITKSEDPYESYLAIKEEWSRG